MLKNLFKKKAIVKSDKNLDFVLPFKSTEDAFSGEELLLTLDKMNNLILTVVSKPFYIKQFNIGSFIKRSDSLEQFANDDDILEHPLKDKIYELMDINTKKYLQAKKPSMFVGAYESITEVTYMYFTPITTEYEGITYKYARLELINFNKSFVNNKIKLNLIGLESLALSKSAIDFVVEHSRAFKLSNKTRKEEE